MTINDDEPQNEYGKGFTSGYQHGYHAGRASRAREIEQYRKAVHQLDQENHQLRRIIGRTPDTVPSR